MRKGKEPIAKRIRCFYWKRRDKGKGGQTILLSVLLFVAVVSVMGLLFHFLKNRAMDLSEVEKVVQEESSEETETGDTLEETGEDDEDEDEEIETEEEVDLSGLDSFHAYMTEESYEQFQIEVEKLCLKNHASSARKLEYQKVSDSRPVVTAYISLSNGRVFETTYNLKSMEFTLKKSDKDETDLEKLLEQAKEKEEKEFREQEKKVQQKLKKKKSKKGGKS